MTLDSKKLFEKIRGAVSDSIVSESEEPLDPFAVVAKDKIVEVCEWLKSDDETKFDYCSCVTGVDDTKTFWVVYHLYSIQKKHSIVLKVDAGRDDPAVPSIAMVWRGADWHEREAYDLYGIKFDGHPDLRRILLPEDWPGHPMRKDYEFPEDYQDIPLR